MSIASPQNDEERRIAQISDNAYEMGWQEGREEQQAEIARLRATIEYTIGWLRESGSDLERQLADKLQAALTKIYSKA